MHTLSSCISRCPSALLSLSVVPIICTARRWQSPFDPLQCIPVSTMGAPGCCACVVVRCLCSCPLASRLGSIRGVRPRCVPCRAVLRGSGDVCVRAPVRLQEARVVWLGGT